MTAVLEVGTRRQVFNGTAKRTLGNLSKHDLIKTPNGIRSRKASAAAKKRFHKNSVLKKIAQFAKTHRSKVKKSKKTKKTRKAKKGKSKH